MKKRFCVIVLIIPLILIIFCLLASTSDFLKSIAIFIIVAIIILAVLLKIALAIISFIKTYIKDNK